MRITVDGIPSYTWNHEGVKSHWFRPMFELLYEHATHEMTCFAKGWAG